MKKRFMLLAVCSAALLWGVSACSHKDGVLPEEEVGTEIRLSTGINVQTRAGFPETDVQIPAGEKVAVWVDHVSEPVTPLYAGRELTAVGDGTLSSQNKMYFPLNGDNVNIYALHTNATYSGTAYPTAMMTHTVDGNQKTLAGYAASDLLYGRTMNIARTKEAVPLTFYHLLSKLQVAICPVEGLTAADIQRVTVSGTKLAANFTPSKAVAPNALGITAGGSASPIEIGTDVSADFTDGNIRYNDVIVVPQRVAAGTAFLTVTLVSGEEIVYNLTADLNFESGKKYLCHMTVNMTEIQLKTSVSDWKPGDLITGNNGVVHYVVRYTDNTSETVYSESLGTVSFNGTGKTVRSIDLPDLGKSYLIGRKDLTSFTLALDDNGDLRFRPSVDGYTPIGSYAELQLINTFPGAMAGHYKQEADLDLMSEEWTPIADGENAKFSGKYDGGDFKIDRLKMEKATGNVGLFGYIDGTYAEIRNVHIASGTVACNGYNQRGAGICGYSNGGNIVHCSNAAQIKGFDCSGGIVGYNSNASTVTACYNSGTVSSSSSYSGGIVGCNSKSIVTSCYWKNGTGMPSNGIGHNNGGTSADVISFTDSFTPDVATYPQWDLGTGSTNGWWKNYNGNNNLPQLWWEK